MSHCEACVLVIFFLTLLFSLPSTSTLNLCFSAEKKGSLVYSDAVPPFSVLALLALFPEFVLFGCGAALD